VNRRLVKIQIVSIAFVALMLLGMVPQAVMAGEVMNQEEELIPKPFTGYDLDNIYIFYDPTDEIMSAVAEGIQEIASFRISQILMVPVTEVSLMEYWLDDDPWVAIYTLDSGLEGVRFPDRNITWSDFYKILNQHRSTQHVVAMGNTLSFDKLLSSEDAMFHHSQSEQTDGVILILYGVYGLMQMCKQRAAIDDDYKGAADDLEQMVLKVYADNFNDLFKRTVEPITPVGEMDPLAAEKRKAEMWARHPGSATPAAYHKAEDGSLEQIPVDELPEDFSPLVKLTSLSEVGSSDFILGDLPLFSGLRGSIGEIIDVLLDVLMSAGKTVLSIPEDALGSLKEVFEMIKPIIGIVEDFDAESPLKSLISGLVKEFPFPEDLKIYLEPILKALFELRGGLDSIVDVIKELVNGLLPALIPQDILDWLDTILDFGGELWDLIEDVIGGGGGAFNKILSFVTNNVLTGLLNKTLTASLGIPIGTITDLVNKTVTVISSVVNYLSSFDFNQFIKDVGNKLLQAGFNLLTDAVGQDTIDRIMALLEAGLSAVDLIDDYDEESLVELVATLAEEFFGASITGSAEELSRQMMQVVKTFQEDGLSSLSQFEDDIETIIDDLTSGLDEDVKAVVLDAVTLIAGFFNDGFDDASIPDLFDVIEGAVNLLPAESAKYTTADAAEIMGVINGAVKPILGIIAQITDAESLKKMVSSTLSAFTSEIGNIPDLISTVIQFLDDGDILSGAPDLQNVLDTFGQITNGVIAVINGVRGQTFEGIMQSLLMAVGSIVGLFPSLDDVPIDAFLSLLQSFFPDAFGLSLEDLPSTSQVISEILGYASGLLEGIIDSDLLETILSFLLDIKGVFTDGLSWLLGKAFDWLTGLLTPLLEDLENTLNGLFGGLSDLLGYDGSLPIGLGDWSLFELTFDLGISANFHINPDPFFEWIKGILFEGRNPFTLSGVGEFFKIVFSFFEISPQFYANLGVEGFDTSKNPFMATMLAFLGVDLAFSGSAHFVLTLFTFREGQFEWEDFFKIVEWGLSIKISMERTITFLDFITGGVGGGVLNKLGEFLGLDSISIDIWFAVELDIVKKAATAIAAEVSTFTLALTIGAALNLGFDIAIVAIKFRGSLEIILTFFMDLAASAPMKITLSLILTMKLTLKFLFAKWTGKWSWEVPGSPWDLSPNKGEPEYENSGMGFDADGDGLSDEYEATIPGLNPNSPDTDNDGASDKLEVQTIGSDPIVADTDEDGLLDGEEWDLGTNPMFPDSDWDKISDYDEVRVYLTDPLSQDTDGDGLSDRHEIFTKLNISGITPTVTEVVIGGETYNDRTDPLNSDTDGDGLVDGDEGPTGAYYGLDSLYNESASDPNPLIFNGGYTHPLDADTDDDSYLQLYNGMIDSQAGPEGGIGYWLKDMNDGAEVAGFWIILYDEEGEPERKQVFTNPVNPDTDGDTGVTDRTPQPGAWLNSDGYELAQTPPTDPTDGDTDDDGLLDGLEGVLKQDSNHTNPNDADTDDDGLFDMQEILLGCDPRNPDSDFDMIPDGEEFYVFFTSPYHNDTDLDGLSDGEEVYFWHSNPLIDDSDGDFLLDGVEVLKYGSDPMDEDGDNDGLTDFEEIKIYYTNPFDYDSDDDGLSDGEEIELYDTDPLNWDTDRDSILEPNEDGDMTWPMSDYDEVKIYGTNATEPDSDMDGLPDAMELYLGSGEIPWLDPIPIDPLDYDTDNDWIADGSELILQNVSDIVYPYRGITVIFRYNTSPVLQDSDNDTLIDFQEVMVFNTNPAHSDTDNDTLSDWHEVWVYNTSAISNDTDGDALYDWEETLYEIYPYGPWPPENWSIGMYPEPALAESASGKQSFALAQYAIMQEGDYGTDALNWDSDGDWLPDGGEVYFYHTQPTDSDSDNDGMDDGFEFDTDYDALSDGMEFKLGLQTIPGGGIMQPDSDLDGLLDGDEYYVYGTDPANSDSDGDGYGDGLEISLGLDPLTFTSKEEFEIALAEMRGQYTLKVMTPINGTTVYQNTPLSVANYTPFSDMWFRFKNGTDEWSDNYYLNHSTASGLWHSQEVRWMPGSYELQVFAKNNSGIVHATKVYFYVQAGDDPFWLYVAIGAAAVIGIVVILGVVDYKTGKVRAGLRRAGGRLKNIRGDGEKTKSTKKSKKSTKKKSKKKKSSSKKSKKGGA
jgi:hypothetical protein